jgi:hypothetical protein
MRILQTNSLSFGNDKPSSFKINITHEVILLGREMQSFLIYFSLHKVFVLTRFIRNDFKLFSLLQTLVAGDI